ALVAAGGSPGRGQQHQVADIGHVTRRVEAHGILMGSAGHGQKLAGPRRVPAPGDLQALSPGFQETGNIEPLALGHVDLERRKALVDETPNRVPTLFALRRSHLFGGAGTMQLLELIELTYHWLPGQ